MMFRFGFSAIFLCLIYLNKLKYIKWVDIKRGSIIGIFMFFSFFTLVTGIQYTTASKQSFIIGSYVLMVPFLSWIINKRKPDIYAIISAILATVGIGLLTIDKNVGFNKGDLISVFAALFFACHMIAIEHYGKDSDPIILTIIQFIVTALLFIFLVGIFEFYDFSILPQFKFSIFYLVIITTVIAFVVQNIAQQYISSTNTALILTLESVFGSIFAIYYLQETMTKQMVIGCFIVFIAIFTYQTKWKFLKEKLINQKSNI